MASSKTYDKSRDELLQNYRPVALRAVAAAHEIKGKASARTPPEEPTFGPLPEGFHMPIELD